MSKLNTYFFNHTETLKIFSGHFTNAIIPYMTKGETYAMMKEHSGVKKIHNFTIFAKNEEGNQYQIVMPGTTGAEVKTFWETLYPNDSYVGIESVDKGKPGVY